MRNLFPAILDRNGCARPLDYYQIDPVNQVRSFSAGGLLISDKRAKTPEKPRKEIIDDYFTSVKDFPKHYSCIVSDPTCGYEVRYPDYLVGAHTETSTNENMDNDDTDSDVSYDSDDSYDSDSSKSKRKRRNLNIRILKKLKIIEKSLLGINKQREENWQRADILQGLLNI